MEKWLQIIIGNLLGDGHIEKKGYSFGLVNTHRDYVEYVHKHLNDHFRSNTKILTRTCPPNKRVKVSSTSHVCKFNNVRTFRPLRDHWYPEGIKIIPQDLRLTPLICRHWYMDDGSLVVHKSGESTKNGTKYRAHLIFLNLHTNGFTRGDVEFLSFLLNGAIGISSYLAKARNDQFQIKMTGEDVVVFLEYIGDCPVSSFEYKWNLKGYKFHDFKCVCGKKIRYGAFRNHKKTCGDLECKAKYRADWQKNNADKTDVYIRTYKERHPTANRDAQRRYRARILANSQEVSCGADSY